MIPLKINDYKNIIKIKSVDDLVLLPDKSIKILFNNSEYMTTLYLYVLQRIDAYLQTKEYSTDIRVKYFNMCVKNLGSLVECEKEYLLDSSKSFVIKSEKFPRNLKKIYKESILSTCHFFSGILSTTQYLDKQLFSREEKQMVRHNYGNMISVLLNSVE
jgi:hypothetical protein